MHFQFGGIPELGCRDGLFTLKALLNTQQNHDLASYVSFVDLVKAYNMANHDYYYTFFSATEPPKNLLQQSKQSTPTMSARLRQERNSGDSPKCWHVTG
jgi:hypothetical protein